MSLWFKHDAHFHEHPKCIRLRRLAGSRADSAELGWFRLIAAGRRIGQWTFSDEEHLMDAADRYYRFVPLYRQVGLLDGLTIHDGEEYQSPLSGAERVARHRARNAPVVTPDVTGVTPSEEKKRVDKKEQTEARDPADIYWELTGRYPTEKATAWIDRLAEQYGAEPVIASLARSHVEDRSTQTLLGRTEDRLRSEARKLDLAERAAEKQRIAEARSKPRPEKQWLAEYRASIEQQYRDMGAA